MNWMRERMKGGITHKSGEWARGAEDKEQIPDRQYSRVSIDLEEG